MVIFKLLQLGICYITEKLTDLSGVILHVGTSVIQDFHQLSLGLKAFVQAVLLLIRKYVNELLYTEIECFLLFETSNGVLKRIQKVQVIAHEVSSHLYNFFDEHRHRLATKVQLSDRKLLVL